MKKYLAFIITIIMVLSLGMNAYADRLDGNSSITINFKPTGSGTRTFTAWRVLSMVENGNGRVQYYLDESDDLFGSSEFRSLFVEEGSVQVDGKEYPALSLREGLNENDIIGFLSMHMPDDSRTQDHPKKTNNQYYFGRDSYHNVYTRDRLPAGYYYIEDSIGMEGILLTLFDNRAESIDAKNYYPSISMSPYRSTADTGGATEQIAVTASFPPHMTTWNYVHITISSQNFSELEIVDESIEHYVRRLPTSTGWRYEFSCQQIIDHIEPDEDGFRTATFTFEGKLKANNSSTRIDEGKVMAFLELFENYGSISLYRSKTEESIINTYYVDVFKYWVDGLGQKAPLKDAEFKLSKQVQDGEQVGTKYLSITDGAVSWVDTIESASIFTSSDIVDQSYNSNLGTIGGLANGTYTLMETKAPDGFNPAPDQTIVIENSDVQIEVQNKSDTLLPETGGIGTGIFYAVGGVLMAAALVILIARKKAEKDQ